jgi:glycine betaine/proline transport system permease protein
MTDLNIESQKLEDRNALIDEFIGTPSIYYQNAFDKIGEIKSFAWIFNWVAALLGPIWYGMRGLWNWALPFVILECFGLIQIFRGLWGDLGAEARDRILQIEGTLGLRYQQLDAAIKKNADNVDVFRRTIKSLEDNIDAIKGEVVKAESTAIWILLSGVAILFLVKAIEGYLANSTLEAKFSNWLSDRTIASGLTPARTGLSIAFVSIIFTASIIHYTFPTWFHWLGEFPTNRSIRLTGIVWVEGFSEFLKDTCQWFFNFITIGIRAILNNLELIFVGTPWIVIASFIILLTGLTAGIRASIFTGAFLAYMGFLGFWEKAMITLSLLGTAAFISIALGIPFGLYCARRPRFYAFIRPIMDFMQTMPAFVFMIPVIAFFGIGKPAAVVLTMIFGGTPVVRLTVLGLRGVPQNIREAAISYGASKWYMLTKVDLPLAAPSILAGINQTIMLSLAMVVVASLIGAKGLGEDVLEALQHNSLGLGMLAGFAILFCAMILDRVVQGQRD